MRNTIPVSEIVAARDGDDALFAALIDEMTPMIKSIAYRLGGKYGNHPVASTEDAMGDAYEAAVRFIREFDDSQVTEINDAYVWQIISTTASKAIAPLITPGVPAHGLRVFVANLKETNNDLYAAYLMCLSHPDKNRRCGEDTAKAVYLSMTAGAQDSSGTEWAVTHDDMGPDEIEESRRRTLIGLVHATLDMMSEPQSVALKARFGIEPYRPMANAELADMLGVDGTVANTRTAKAKARFKKLFPEEGLEVRNASRLPSPTAE